MRASLCPPPTVLVDLAPPIGRITLNRPDKLNALTFPMIAEINDALDQAKDIDGLRAIVFSGAGRAFCAGDDLTGMDGTGDLIKDVDEGHHRMIRQIRQLPMPVIGKLNGLTLGAGFDLCLAFDFRVALEGIRLGDVRANRAINAMSGSTYWLPKLIGLGRATEIIFSGRYVPTDESVSIGLIHACWPADRFEAEAESFISRWAKGPTKTYGLNKGQINCGLDQDLNTELALENDGLMRTMSSEDVKEGVMAFIERRDPKFIGK